MLQIRVVFSSAWLGECPRQSDANKIFMSAYEFILSHWKEADTLHTLTFREEEDDDDGGLKTTRVQAKNVFFLHSLAGVNHNSKPTNRTLIQFMNYAVVIATLIKMRQSADHFVDELMIY